MTPREDAATTYALFLLLCIAAATIWAGAVHAWAIIRGAHQRMAGPDCRCRACEGVFGRDAA